MLKGFLGQSQGDPYLMRSSTSTRVVSKIYMTTSVIPLAYRADFSSILEVHAAR